jgi:glycosyltransferase involved in cell wall biosynthesis
MRIAVLAPLVSPIVEPQLGGSQALLADLSLALVERGHAVRVYAASGSRIDGVAVVDTGVDAESLAATLFRAGADGIPSAEGNGAGDASEAARVAFERAAALIAADGPDVVHAHAFDAPAVEVVAALGVPAIQVLHLPPTADVAATVREVARASMPPTVVTVSHTMHEAWRGAGVDARVIRNGVPVERIPWSASPGEGLVFAGRLSPEKGALDAIEIARIAELPLTIVGPPYDGAHAGEVGRRAAEAGATVLEPLPRSELWRRMAAAAAVLCPVRWDEPFGLVAAEAQAAGTPVVGYRRGALPEVIEHGTSGFLVGEGEVAAAARWVADARRLDRTAIRDRAAEMLNLEAMADRYERLSLELANAAVGPGRSGG